MSCYKNLYVEDYCIGASTPSAFSMKLIYSLSHLFKFVENHLYFKWPECLSGC